MASLCNLAGGERVRIQDGRPSIVRCFPIYTNLGVYVRLCAPSFLRSMTKERRRERHRKRKNKIGVLFRLSTVYDAASLRTPPPTFRRFHATSAFQRRFLFPTSILHFSWRRKRYAAFFFHRSSFKDSEGGCRCTRFSTKGNYLPFNRWQTFGGSKCCLFSLELWRELVYFFKGFPQDCNHYCYVILVSRIRYLTFVDEKRASG